MFSVLESATPNHGGPRPEPRRCGDRLDRFSRPGVEPTLEELLSDPLTVALMQRDGVEMGGLRALIREAQKTLRSRAHG